MSPRDLPYDPVAPEERRLRHGAAGLLRAASRLLDALAERLALADAPAATAEPVLEFYGDAAAPEGALYVNGQLVGRVLGVNRL
ncbi:MAG: hypothetical protein LH480_07915 [Rubrivivax sp.]|nr:hypothetical protein [Rubrivivax sp.]